MVNKLTAVSLLLGALLVCHPVQAQTSNQQAQPVPSPQVTVLPGKEAAPALAVPEAAVSDVDYINLTYVKGMFVDTGRMFAAPVHWEGKDWLKFGLVLGVTSGLFLVDEKVKDFAQSHQSRVASKFASVGNAMGEPLYTLPPVGAFYLYGYLADDSKARRTSLMAMESLAISSAMTSGLKVLVERHRPNTGGEPGYLDGPKFSLRNLSFSSGHTASAFSIATVFANQYQDNPFVPPIAYGLAALTGLSRIYSNEHWSSDAFFGGALGYFISKAVLSYHKEDKDKLANHLTILPQVGKEMNGLSVKYDF